MKQDKHNKDARPL